MVTANSSQSDLNGKSLEDKVREVLTEVQKDLEKGKEKVVSLVILDIEEYNSKIKEVLKENFPSLYVVDNSKVKHILNGSGNYRNYIFRINKKGNGKEHNGGNY